MRRGFSLVEVLISISLLTLVFLAVTENMIAASLAVRKASQHSLAISTANYYLGLMQDEPKLWNLALYDGAPGPTPVDPCGNALSPVHLDQGPTKGGTWRNTPDCSKLPEGMTASGVQYQWYINFVNGTSANLVVWVKVGVPGSNRVDLYEVNGFSHSPPNGAILVTAPPQYTPPPTAPPTPPPTDTPPPTAPPSPGDTPSAAPTDAPTEPPPTEPPSPTPTPAPTPTPTDPPIGV